MKKQFFVFLADSDPAFHHLYQKQFNVKLQGKNAQVSIISAFSLDDAVRKYEANQTIDVIVMTACLPQHLASEKPQIPNTAHLVEFIRKTYEGRMIATSSLQEYRTYLLKAGCNFECEKKDLTDTVLQVFGL